MTSRRRRAEVLIRRDDLRIESQEYRGRLAMTFCSGLSQPRSGIESDLLKVGFGGLAKIGILFLYSHNKRTDQTNLCLFQDAGYHCSSALSRGIPPAYVCVQCIPVNNITHGDGDLTILLTCGRHNCRARSRAPVLVLWFLF